jgi:hypothetical protein
MTNLMRPANKVIAAGIALMFLGAIIFSAQALAAPKKTVPPFKLNLTLAKEEFGDESSSDIYYVSIVDQNVKYAWKHTGPPAARQKHHTYKLSPQGLHNLKTFIKQEQLNQNVNEIKPETSSGIAVRFNFTLTTAGKATKAHISGMYRRLDAPEENQANIENLEYLRKAQKILTAVIQKQESF